MSENNNTDLNEVFEEEMDDADVITVPIDETLSKSGEAADAKAVGDALALKADKSELQAAVKVNNQPADAQGLILIDGRHIPVSDQDAETLAVAVTDLKGKTAENILMSSNSGAKTIAEVVNANAEAIESMEEMTGAKMPIESGSQTTVKAAIEARVKTVNRKVPDADGDVDLSVVPLAENLQSDKMESVEGSFIIRTTGGNASVSDGKAYPLHLFGSADHTGYVAEQLNMTVIPITRTEPDEPITATIDRDTFVAYVEESGTINLYYTTEWSADPELYGITVTGTPVAGDQITVVYVKEVRGTITVANPARLVGTGWNLFDYNNGYAHVVKYSTEYGYKIGGSYTSIQFSATLTGERTSITPSANGLFNVNSDGYVFVTGGNNTDTYILATWSDWRNGPSTGYWESYRESGIDLSAVMTTYFPNGLLAVGTIRDEIDLSAKRSISRIERLAYSEENRAAAAATGRSYDFDQNYIYIARESAVLSAITIDTTYNVSEHGLELFTETALPVITEILYGKNLRDKLERDVLTISPQDLAAEEQAQVRRNIGVMDPPLNGNGTAAQLLKTNGDGTTEWTTQGTPTDAQVGTAVSAWLEEHPEATTTVQDGAISRAKLNDDLKAKTDAVPDLKSAVNEYTEELFVKSVKDISNNHYAAQIINDLWNRSGSCAIIPVPDEVVKISATANNTLSTDIAFLTSNAHNGNTAPNYVTGTSVITINADTTTEIHKPVGCKYLYILKSTVDGGTDRVPSEVGFYSLKDVLLLDQSLTISGDAADAKATGDSIRELQDRLLYTAEEKDISNNYYAAQIINDLWNRSGRCVIIPVPDEVVKISVTANNTLSTDIAFLTSNAHNGNTIPAYVTSTGLITISTGETYTSVKPIGCTYMYILKSKVDGGSDRVPSEVVYYTYKKNNAVVIPLGLHEMPRDTNALNIVKRCRQMTDIKWTPAVDLSRYMLVQRGDDIPDSAEAQNYIGIFKAGVEYTGVPYGRVNATMTTYGYEYATVGHYIDFETFISSVMNPNTLLSLNNVGSVTNHRSVIYATVCSGLTCYALNVPEVPTASISQIAGLQLIGKINNNGTLLADNEFEIGDVLNKYDYHTAIITDIIRNTDGEIVSIELSDASTAGLADKNYSDGQIGGICRRKGWTRQQLFDASSWGDYSLYRYSGSVPYMPNPYVNVGDEFDMRRIEHFPCMPYEGNKFCYKTGYIPNNAIRLQIMLSGYAYLKVFKNGTEISGSPFAIEQETKRINISEISVGNYSAYLCNITGGNVVNLTYPCEWTIV